MRRTSVLALTLAVPLTAFAIGGAHSRANFVGAGRAAEVKRIRAHFDSVLAELPMRDLTGLPTGQVERRSRLIETLRAYRDRGDFPHNYDFPDQAVPYFVDRKTGVLCAVAHLLESSGRRDIVDRVGRINNNVWVAQLAEDTAFTGWLDASGFTLEEAARIQVPYVADDSPAPAFGTRSSTYAIASVSAISASLVTSVWNGVSNADGRGRVANIVGMATGFAALGLGAASAGSNNVSPALGVTNAVVGATSIFLSTRGIIRNHRAVAARREAERTRQAMRASVAPIVDVTSAGLAVTVRF